MRLAQVVCAFLLFMFLSVSARACSCREPSPVCSVYFGTPAIFRGLAVEKVLERPPAQTMRDQDGKPYQIMGSGRYRVTFAVNEQFRGETKRQVTVYTSDESTACGFDFQPGTEYVVFAGTNRQGDQLSTSVCTMTHAVRDLAKDEVVQGMRALATAPSGARIFGSVHLGQEETVPRVTLTVRGPLTLNATTDAAGAYDLKGLPPGQYTVAATLPNGFVTGPEQSFTLADKACAEANWYASYDAHVRGRVVGTGGTPIAHLYMELERRGGAEAGGLYAAETSETDEDGRYEFQRVPPGEYFVIANSLGSAPDRPYPMMYFPASPTVDNAATVQVKASESLADVNVEMPRAWNKINVLVKVVLATGSPAAGVTVEGTLVSDGFSVSPMTAITGADGVATLPVYEGQEYFATALGDGMPQHCGGPVRFLAKAGADLGVIRIEHPLDDCLAQMDSASIHPAYLAQ